FGGCVAVCILGDNIRVKEFVVKVVTFTGTFTHASEHGGTAMAFGNVVDQFLNKNGLANAGAAEQADLAALCVGCEQIDNLNAGDKDFTVCGLVNEKRRFCVNRGR